LFYLFANFLRNDEAYGSDARGNLGKGKIRQDFAYAACYGPRFVQTHHRPRYRHYETPRKRGAGAPRSTQTNSGPKAAEAASQEGAHACEADGGDEKRQGKVISTEEISMRVDYRERICQNWDFGERAHGSPRFGFERNVLSTTAEERKRRTGFLGSSIQAQSEVDQRPRRRISREAQEVYRARRKVIKSEIYLRLALSFQKKLGASGAVLLEPFDKNFHSSGRAKMALRQKLGRQVDVGTCMEHQGRPKTQFYIFAT
jgi:hypothetical protein